MRRLRRSLAAAARGGAFDMRIAFLDPARLRYLSNGSLAGAGIRIAAVIALSIAAVARPTFAAEPEQRQGALARPVATQVPAAPDRFARADAAALSAIRRSFSREGYADAERMARELLVQAAGRGATGRTNWAATVWIARCRAATRQPDAETWFTRAIEGAESIFGPEHANCASSLDELADYYRVHGRPIDAEPLYQRALAIREKALGEWHPETADNLAVLGNLRIGMGNYDAARPLLERALDIRQHALGAASKEALDTQFDLARLAHIQRRHDDAEKLYKRVLAKREALLGDSDPEVATVLDAMARLNMELGRTPLAEQQFKRVLAIRERSRGRDHWEILATLNELIRLYQARGNQSAARPLMERAQAILRANAAKHKNPVNSPPAARSVP